MYTILIIGLFQSTLILYLTNPVLQIEHNHAGSNQILIIYEFKNEIKSQS